MTSKCRKVDLLPDNWANNTSRLGRFVVPPTKYSMMKSRTVFVIYHPTSLFTTPTGYCFYYPHICSHSP